MRRRRRRLLADMLRRFELKDRSGMLVPSSAALLAALTRSLVYCMSAVYYSPQYIEFVLFAVWQLNIEEAALLITPSLRRLPRRGDTCISECRTIP